jgi:hypothetical protein
MITAVKQELTVAVAIIRELFSILLGALLYVAALKVRELGTIINFLFQLNFNCTNLHHIMTNSLTESAPSTENLVGLDICSDCGRFVSVHPKNGFHSK